MRSILIIALILSLFFSPVAFGATNAYTLTRTNTAELSNGAYYSGFSISGDKMTLTGGPGEYVGSVLSLANLTHADVNYTSYYAGESTLDYGFLYGTAWLNSTDGRHLTNGDVSKGIRYPFTSQYGSLYTPDEWIIDSSTSHNDLGLYYGAAIAAVVGKPYQNYLNLDGTDDYGRVGLTYDYDSNAWYMAAMVKPTRAGGVIFSMTDSASNAYIMVEHIDAATDYIRVHLVDQNGKDYNYGSSSAAFSINQWHYVVLKCDGTNLYLYSDGVLCGTGPIQYNSASQFDLDYIALGAVYYGGHTPIGFLKGYLDEFRFNPGLLQAGEQASTGIQGAFMWNCVNGNQPAKHANYIIGGSGSVKTVITGYSSANFDITDYSYSLLNTKPVVLSMFPNNGHVYDTNPTVTLAVNGTDADLTGGYAVTLGARFYVDGNYVGFATRSGPGVIAYNVGSYTGGSHTWQAVLYDTWGGETISQEETFNVLSTLYIRGETNPENLIDEVNVNIGFYTQDTSVTRITTDGTIDLTGLPITELLVSATAEGYTPRKTIITSLYDTQNVYLIPANASLLYNTFKLNTQSVTFPITQYWVEVQKPINGTVGTVFSSYFAFDGSCGTYLIETDVYRLVIHSPDGSSVSYGWLFPDPDGIMEITISSVAGYEVVNDWLTSVFTMDDDLNSIAYTYSATKAIEQANFTISEENLTLQEYSVDTETGVFVFNSDNQKHEYLVTVNILTEVGETYAIKQYITLNQEHINPFPASYPDWLKQILVTAIAIMCLLAFSSYRSDVGCIAGAGVFCIAYMFAWFPIGQTVIFTMILIATASVIQFKRKQDKGLY